MSDEIVVLVIAVFCFLLGFLLRGELGNFRKRRKEEKT